MRSVELVRHMVAYTFSGDTELSLNYGDDMKEVSYQEYRRQTVLGKDWKTTEERGESTSFVTTLMVQVQFPINEKDGVRYDRVGVWANSELRYVIMLAKTVDCSPQAGVYRSPAFAPGSIVNIETQ